MSIPVPKRPISVHRPRSSCRSTFFSFSLAAPPASSTTSMPSSASRYFIPHITFHTYVYLLITLALLSVINHTLLFEPSTSFIRVRGQTLVPSPPPSLPHTAIKIFRGVRIHPLTELLHNLISTYRLQSMLDYPCGTHSAITPPLLLLLHRNNPLSNFRYICMDSDSRHLATAHAAISQLLPDFRPVFQRANFTRDPASADLLLAWGVPRDINSVRLILLLARASGVRFAVVRAVAMEGIAWNHSQDPVSTFTSSVYGDAPFPFSHALIAASSAYGDDFVLVYNLAMLPKLTNHIELAKVKVERDMLRANYG